MATDEQRAKWRESTRRWREANPAKNREVARSANARYYAPRREAARLRREQRAAKREADMAARTASRETHAAAKAAEREARRAAAELRHKAAMEHERVRRKAERRRYEKRYPHKKREYRKRWRLGDPARTVMHDRTKGLKRHGLTPEDYDAMFEAQGGLCAICHAPETRTTIDKVTGLPRVSALAVDHDHDTEAVRDLLCLRCNNLLGLLEPEPEIVTTMIAYLAYHSLKGAAA